MPASILIVEDEKNTREGLAMALGGEYDIYEAANAEEAFRLMESEEFDVILTDLRMAGKSGLSIIDRAMSLANHPTCIMMTAYGSVETAVEAMKRGAYDFLTKPVNLEKLEILIKRALKSKDLEIENEHLHERLDKKYKQEGAIIGESAALRDCLRQLEQVAPTKATILLQGETGTGKELFAQMIHQKSPRARKAFVAVHCAALPANLLESELLGHEKGAFTGATQRRVGRFENADGGTLFLDEIGEIDAGVQVKLLRFLETRTFERLGSSSPITVDVRLVCATNRDLEAMVKRGEFREDLFYRLNVVRIHLPSLRERKEDIDLLMDYYIKKYAQENGVEEPQLNLGVREIMKNYGWPGNIRELRNFCEHLVIMKHGRKVAELDLDVKYQRLIEESILEKQGKEKQEKGVDEETFQAISGKGSEKELFLKALAKAQGNKTKAAEFLGISRRTLHRKLEKWVGENEK